MTRFWMFLAAAAGALVLLSAGCDLTDPDTRVEDLEAQYQRWLDHRPDGYRARLDRRCPCPEDVQRPSWILVQRDAVVEVLDVETGEAVDPQGPRAVTIDDIFRHLIEHVQRRDSHLSARFNPEFNYPIEAHGWVGGALGDEFLYRIVEFTADPPL